MKTPTRIHDAVRRLKSRAPNTTLLLGVWSANDEKALSGLKDAVNADYTARSFHQALAILLKVAAEQSGEEGDHMNETASLVLAK